MTRIVIGGLILYFVWGLAAAVVGLLWVLLLYGVGSWALARRPPPGPPRGDWPAWRSAREVRGRPM